MSRWGNPGHGNQNRRAVQTGGRSHMWGMGNRNGPNGPDEASERALFKVLETKDSNGASKATGSRKFAGRSVLGLLVIAAVIASAFVVIPLASSAGEDIAGFELDGNVADGPGAGDDWATLFNSSGQPTGDGSARATVFVADGTGATDTGFTGGGSKDDLDITGWKWSVGVTPAKDDIKNAYAAAYVEQGAAILYFGQERVDTQAGTANMGFWFLQDPTVGANASGGFDGKHVDGDILVQSSLVNGGGVSIVRVFKWEAGKLVEVTGLNAGACALGKLGKLNACAFANTDTITRPWGPDLASPYFYEGGLNLSALFPGQALPCFSAFVSNTRSSAPSDAVLKDFAAGALDTCGSIKIKKMTDPAGSAQQFDFTSDVAGHLTFKLADGQTETLAKLNAGTY